MKRKWLLHVLMDVAGGEGGGGGGEGGGHDGEGSGDGASVLAGGQPTEFMPEKYRVTKEDGTFDLEASSRKLADAYTAAEKRIGSGDIPPKSAEEYTVTVPDALKEAFDPKSDDGYKAFSSKMHGLGLTQKQMDGVMESYFESATQLANGAAGLDEKAARGALEKVWGTGNAYDAQVKLSYQGAAAIASKAGLNIDELMHPARLGNNVDFLRLMAAIGPEFAEARSPGGQGVTVPSSEEEIDKLMMSDAYKNPKDPEHAKVSKMVQAFFQKKYPGEVI